MSSKLVIAGAGIKSISHLTYECIIAVQQADIVLYLLNEPIICEWVKENAKKTLSLNEIYFSEHKRIVAYEKITNIIESTLHLYKNVCFVVYGHPILLSNISGFLIKKVEKNTEVFVIPGISSFDSMLADLKIDPIAGCLCIEANALLNKSTLDTTNHLIVWQVGIIDNSSTKDQQTAIHLLIDKLILYYPSDYFCTLYEASLYPHIPPRIECIQIVDLNKVNISRISTLYVAPI